MYRAVLAAVTRNIAISKPAILLINSLLSFSFFTVLPDFFIPAHLFPPLGLFQLFGKQPFKQFFCFQDILGLPRPANLAFNRQRPVIAKLF